MSLFFVFILFFAIVSIDCWKFFHRILCFFGPYPSNCKGQFSWGMMTIPFVRKGLEYNAHPPKQTRQQTKHHLHTYNNHLIAPTLDAPTKWNDSPTSCPDASFSTVVNSSIPVQDCVVVMWIPQTWAILLLTCLLIWTWEPSQIPFLSFFSSLFFEIFKNTIYSLQADQVKKKKIEFELLKTLPKIFSELHIPIMQVQKKEKQGKVSSI